MIEVLQINLRHTAAAQQLFWQTTLEHKIDVALVSEPHKPQAVGPKWVTDRAREVAIVATGNYPIQQVLAPSTDGYCMAVIGGVTYCSVYAPPRWTVVEYESMLIGLTADLAGRSKVVIGGDFNAWSTQWGSRSTNARGRLVMEFLERLDVVLLNTGLVTTFRGHGGESTIDLTYCSPGMAASSCWRVDERIDTHSDHEAIRFRVVCQRTTQTGAGSRGVPIGPTWGTRQFNRELFVEAFHRESHGVATADSLVRALERACDVTMPRNNPNRLYRATVYWWSETINSLRAACFAARRRAQRARGSDDWDLAIQAYKVARKALNREIRASKKRSFELICSQAEEDPWGKAFQVVMGKLRGSQRERSTQKLSRIADALFPVHDEMHWPEDSEWGAPLSRTESEVTTGEIIAEAKHLKDGKAPGPNGVPNVALKAAATDFPEVFRRVFQEVFDSGVFPSQWKRQKLVVIPKPGKPPELTSSWRPLCMMDGEGKLAERLMLNRLYPYIEGAAGLSANQYGFRKGRSTVDAIASVVSKGLEAMEDPRRYGKPPFLAVITIDVANAFNTASWTAIGRGLASMGVPAYLGKLVKSYFEDRVLLLDTEDGILSRRVSAGVPQGSILGPALWNVLYNGLLNLGLPIGCSVVGFADDLVLLVEGETELHVETRANEAIERIERWMCGRRLAMAHHKTEFILVSAHKNPRSAQIVCGDATIRSTQTLKYLGVVLDDRLRFNAHVDYCTAKASAAMVKLSHMLANRRGPSARKRRLLSCVATSLLRYGAPAWTRGLRTQWNRTHLESAYRHSTIRVCSAWRSTSGDAACVIASMVPICLTLREDARVYARKSEVGETLSLVSLKSQERERTLQEWQERWDCAEHGRWTYRLIPDVQRWMNRRHGEVNFYLTQVLSGHGYFREHLHRLRLAESAECPVCLVPENAEHVVFRCPRFERERAAMDRACGESISVGSITRSICSDVSIWNAVSRSIKAITRQLENDWRVERRRRDAEAAASASQP